MNAKVIRTLIGILFAGILTSCGSNQLRIEMSAESTSNRGYPTIDVDTSLPDGSVIDAWVTTTQDWENGSERTDAVVSSGHASLSLDNNGLGYPNGSYQIRVFIDPEHQSEELKNQIGNPEKDVILTAGLDVGSSGFAYTPKVIYRTVYLDINDSKVVLENKKPEPKPEVEKKEDDFSSEDFWASRNTPEKKLEDYIWSRVHNEYDRTTVNRVEINEDLGTDTEGDYIALVYLTWDVKNKPDMTETMLQMYSDDLAASLATDHPEVQEVAIFWQVPYLGTNTSKWSYERRDGAMYATDKVLGF